MHSHEPHMPAAYADNHPDVHGGQAGLPQPLPVSCLAWCWLVTLVAMVNLR